MGSQGPAVDRVGFRPASESQCHVDHQCERRASGSHLCGRLDRPAVRGSAARDAAGHWKLLHLIVEGLSAHKALAVKEYAAELNGKLTVYYLPGYAPDLNPDEFGLEPRQPLQKGERLATRITTQLTEIARCPALIRSFFRRPSVTYISA